MYITKIFLEKLNPKKKNNFEIKSFVLYYLLNLMVKICIVEQIVGIFNNLGYSVPVAKSLRKISTAWPRIGRRTTADCCTITEIKFIL